MMITDNKYIITEDDINRFVDGVDTSCCNQWWLMSPKSQFIVARFLDSFDRTDISRDELLESVIGEDIREWCNGHIKEETGVNDD